MWGLGLLPAPGRHHIRLPHLNTLSATHIAPILVDPGEFVILIPGTG